MPLLPRGKARYDQDLAETEARLDRWIAEVSDLLATSNTSVVRQTQSLRITAVRASFAAMREGSHASAT